MEPMRRPDDLPTDYERGIIKESALLSESTVESTVFGVTLLWNHKSVSNFVAVANRNHIVSCPPVWMSQPQGQITEQVFKSDIMTCLAEVAGGLARHNDLAPNTIWHTLNITKRFGQVESDPFVQACMAQLDTDAYLADVLVRHESPGFGISPMNLQPPFPPHRQIFH
ncbi:hypothetical protein PHPALM_31488 [Phytophthora palmivora]|uniref:Uncharacterized protein n=1 Tax=Phytophthora palmivora TaxID=4796 RepID=A0A2P4X2F2_9STRA|nr:hypothetical protein PHPALM_31488 [Phytophthora palmivora]